MFRIRAFFTRLRVLARTCRALKVFSQSSIPFAEGMSGSLQVANMFHRAMAASRLGVVLWAAQLSFSVGQPTQFESSAQLHRILRLPVSGRLFVDDDGIEFRAGKLSHRWGWGDIRTFTLSGPQAVTITDYENRHWHEPGEQTFTFTLAIPVPPGLAARMAAMVARPVINGDPEPNVSSIAEIPAHRRERFGGSNGTLRFREDGIDYATPDDRDGRSWRWSDIQTIANSDPWQFRVTAYREIVEFDLKQPMPRALFDRLWTKLYASDLNLNPRSHGGNE